jgi:hypothetical protein
MNKVVFPLVASLGGAFMILAVAMISFRIYYKRHQGTCFYSFDVAKAKQCLCIKMKDLIDIQCLCINFLNYKRTRNDTFSSIWILTVFGFSQFPIM